MILSILLLTGSIFALEWEKNMDVAIIKAKNENKNIMVLVEGENCRWCQKMKDRTLSDDAVVKRLEKFVLVKVMREDMSVMEKLPPVSGVPTVLAMEEHKTVIEDIIGYFNVQDFLSYINDVEKKVKQTTGSRRVG